MKKMKYIALLLIVCMALAPISADAKTIGLKKILNRLTKPRATSLQKMDIVEKFKGELVRGAGTVKDVLKSFGEKDEAMVYLKKYYKGKEYELVLVVPKEQAAKVRKGMGVKFKGVFAGMTFQTLRFENTELIKRFLWFF